MPKVYLPLGSAAASGQFGEMMVFQGTNVRSYVVPVDPRSDAQLDVRHLFYDVTKIMRTLGLLGKGLLAAYIGPRWYTDSYKRVSENAAARLIAEGVNWDAFTEPQKEEWRAAAPFVATYNDPGEMYFCIARILNEWIEPITGADFLSVYPNPTTAAAYRAAWDVGLDDVVTLSKTNDDDDRLVYSGTWSTQSDASAFGGSYTKTSTPNSQCFFYFTGNQISLGFVGLTNGGTLQAEFSDGETIQIDQYRAVATYGLAAVKNFLTAGVHWVRLGFFGSGTQVVNLDSIDGAKIKGALPAVPGNEISHSALEDLANDDHPQYYNQARGDARYLQSVPQQDHGGLAGNGDDDHQQYHNDTRGDARYGAKTDVERLRDWRVTWTTHFDASPGWSWMNQPTGTNGIVSIGNSMFKLQADDSLNKCFYYQTGDFTSKDVRLMGSVELNCESGFRLDDGTDNNYWELYLEHESAGKIRIYGRTRTGGAAAVETAYITGLPTQKWGLRVAHGGTSLYYYIFNGNAESISYIGSKASVSPGAGWRYGIFATKFDAGSARTAWWDAWKLQ